MAFNHLSIINVNAVWQEWSKWKPGCSK
jgi:hypothetical protein